MSAFNGLSLYIQRNYSGSINGTDTNQRLSSIRKIINRFLIENNLPCDKKQRNGIYCKNSETAQKHFSLFANWCKFNLVSKC